MATVQGAQRALPYKEVDPATFFIVSLCRKLHLFLGKSTKTAATRAALFDFNMHQIVGWGSLLRSTDPVAVFRGPTSKGRGGERIHLLP